MSENTQENKTPKTQEILNNIKERYERIKNNQRRPSLEYIDSETIREIFLPFARDKESFMKMSHEALQKLYTSWLNRYMKNEDDENSVVVYETDSESELEILEEIT